MTHLEVRKSPQTSSSVTTTLEDKLRQHVGSFGKSCLTVLRAAEPFHYSLRIIVLDSLFCSVKSVVGVGQAGLVSSGHCSSLQSASSREDAEANDGRPTARYNGAPAHKGVRRRYASCGLSYEEAPLPFRVMWDVKNSPGQCEKRYPRDNNCFVDLKTPRYDMI